MTLASGREIIVLCTFTAVAAQTNRPSSRKQGQTQVKKALASSRRLVRRRIQGDVVEPVHDLRHVPEVLVA